MTSSDVIAEIDGLLDHHTHQEISVFLNERGLRSGKDQIFTTRYIARIQKVYALKPRYDRLREAGMLTVQEMAQALGLHPQTVRIWRAHGLLQAHAYTDKGEYLDEPPGKEPPKKAQGVKLSRRSPEGRLIPDRAKEVQCEA
jgi:hypothetical protein